LKWQDDSGNDKITETDNEKTSTLAEFFSQCILWKTTRMSDISKDAIESKLSKLKTDKSPGMDQIHPRVLYETRYVISYPLFLIFHKSLALGKLPSDWKLAEVTALYKKGPKSNKAKTSELNFCLL